LDWSISDDEDDGSLVDFIVVLFDVGYLSELVLKIGLNGSSSE
jgi:hypothetical protein